MKISRFALIVIQIMVLTFVGCKRGDAGRQDSTQLKVAATIFPLKDIIANIGGDRVVIVTILPPGASPHTFEVRPDTVKAAMGIRAIFKIGAGLDDWAEGIAGALEEKPKIIDVSGTVTLRKLPDGSIDPHYWLSLENGVIIAKNVTESLCELDPANKEFYAKNLAGYLQELAKADEELKKMFAGLSNKSFATFHEAWFYFANAYGLEVAAAFEPFPGKEPTPEFLAEFIKTVREHNLKVIFSEPQFSPEAMKQLAKDLGVRLEQLDPEGGGTDETQSYIAMMRFNAQVIYKALNSK